MDPHHYENMQKMMIENYLASAERNITLKSEILGTTSERIQVCNAELDLYQKRLNERLASCPPPNYEPKTYGRVPLSLASSSQSVTSKYSLESLQNDIERTKNRLKALKDQRAEAERRLEQSRRGAQCLNELSQGSPHHYHNPQPPPSDDTLLIAELQRVEETLLEGQREREQWGIGESVPLDPRLVPVNPGTNPIADLARRRLQYNELRRQLKLLQRDLGEVESQIDPEPNSDRDYLALLWEKECLLGELKSLNLKECRDPKKKEMVKEKVQALEEDLSKELNTDYTKEMENRLRIHNHRAKILQTIEQNALMMADLEQQLKAQSQSTLSFFSASSMGSPVESQTNLGEMCVEGVRELRERFTNNLMLTSMPNLGGPASSGQADPAYSGSLQQLAGPPPPSYDSCLRKKRASSQKIEQQGAAEELRTSNPPHPPLSTHNSNESMAGDSGVCDHPDPGVSKKFSPTLNPTYEKNEEKRHRAPQLALEFSYDFETSQILLKVEKGRNMLQLVPHTTESQSYISIRGAFLPRRSDHQDRFETRWCPELDKPNFDELFRFGMGVNEVKLKVLVLQVLFAFGDQTISIGQIQISMAEFNKKMTTAFWVNVLSMGVGRGVVADDEPGSDSSTIAGGSKQSTLTREQAPSEMDRFSSKTKGEVAMSSSQQTIEDKPTSSRILEEKEPPTRVTDPGYFPAFDYNYECDGNKNAALSQSVIVGESEGEEYAQKIVINDTPSQTPQPSQNTANTSTKKPSLRRTVKRSESDKHDYVNMPYRNPEVDVEPAPFQRGHSMRYAVKKKKSPKRIEPPKFRLPEKFVSEKMVMNELDVAVELATTKFKEEIEETTSRIEEDPEDANSQYINRRAKGIINKVQKEAKKQGEKERHLEEFKKKIDVFVNI